MTYRALVVTTVHVPLDARIHNRQIRALRAAGWEVTYAAPFTDYGIEPDQVAVGVRTLDLPRSRGRSRWGAVRAARRIVETHGPAHDVVLLHDPELLLTLPGNLRRLPVVVWDVHEDTAGALVDRPWVPSWLRAPVARLVTAAERWAARRVELLLAEERYQDRFPDQHPVVPNVPYLPEAAGPDDDPSGRDVPRAIYLGRVSALRGAHELVAVAQELAGEVEVHLIGPADADVAGAVGAAADAGEIHAHGFVPNEVAVEHLGAAAVGLTLLHDIPNYRVSLPTKVIEYLAAGVPVVTTPLPEAARLVREADAGIVVPFGDAPAAAQAVRQLIADEPARRAMGQRGRELVRERYSWDAHGPRFVAHLERWVRA